MTAPAPLPRERIEELIREYGPGFDGSPAETVCEAIRELLHLREQVEALREVAVEALDEWEYASKYKGDYLAEKHGDAERIVELRARIGRNPDGTWADSALAKQGGATE